MKSEECGGIVDRDRSDLNRRAIAKFDVIATPTRKAVDVQRGMVGVRNHCRVHSITVGATLGYQDRPEIRSIEIEFPGQLTQYTAPLGSSRSAARNAASSGPTAGSARSGRRSRRPRGRERLQEYDESTRSAIDRASHLIDASAAVAVWEEALATPAHSGPAVWVQGDLEGNCLVRDGHLCGIVDWGSACAGDPAVDVQVVWSPLFTEESRRAFVDALDVDDATLARSRGAAINQACAALPYYLHTYPLIVERSWHKLASLGVPPRLSE